MGLRVLEGVVERGQIRLRENLELPDNTRVYIIIPGEQAEVGHIYSPRLLNRSDLPDFQLEVREAGPDANI